MFICLVDGCHHYQNLTDAERKYDYNTQAGNNKCDKELRNKGWHRFQGAAGTKMATKSPGFRKCGASFPAWLNGAHTTVAEGTVRRYVCSSDEVAECKEQSFVDVKNCTSYYVYKFYALFACPFRYCGTDQCSYSWPYCQVSYRCLFLDVFAGRFFSLVVFS